MIQMRTQAQKLRLPKARREQHRGFCVCLTSCDSRSEYVGIEAIVIAELKLRDVQRHIFGAHFVKCANDAPFEDRPKALDCVGVDRADDILLFAVVNHCVGERCRQINVAGPRVRSQQAYFIGNSFPDKFGYARTIDAFQDAGDNVALALHGTDDWRFIGGNAALAASFIPVAVFVLAADIGFVHFDNAAELLFRFDQGRADFVAHTPCRLVAPEAHVAHDLQCTHAFFAGEHKVGDFEPVAERLVGVLKNRASDDREAVAGRAAGSALRALPVPLAGMQVIDGGIAAARAADAFRPAAGLQVRFAGVVVTDWEHILKLRCGHLMNRLRTFCHGGRTPQYHS